MKKILLTLTVLTLLAGCEESAPVVETPIEEPTEETSQKVMAPQPFYIISVTTDGRMAGGNEINTDPVAWLSMTDGTCLTRSPDTEGKSEEELGMPVCNPNGFLIINESSDDTAGYMIADDTPVYVQNLATVLGMDFAGTEVGTLITFEQLTKAFEENPEFFETTPFIFEFGTVTVDGLEMSDQVSAIKEIYIP